MTPLIRPEAPSDVTDIHALTAAAFLNAPHTAHTEQFIVDALRDAGALTLSLVAEDEGTIVGHVAVSPISVSDGAANWYGLGPISVLPERQGQGIGSLLMRAAMHALRDRGGAGCTLAGAPAFYTRFGFAANPGLTLPGVPPEYFLVLPFSDSVPKGVVTYHAAFEARGEARLPERHSGG